MTCSRYTTNAAGLSPLLSHPNRFFCRDTQEPLRKQLEGRGKHRSALGSRSTRTQNMVASNPLSTREEFHPCLYRLISLSPRGPPACTFWICSKLSCLLRARRARTGPGRRAHARQLGVGTRLRPQIGRTWGRPRKLPRLKRGCEGRHRAIRAPRYDSKRVSGRLDACCPWIAKD